MGVGLTVVNALSEYFKMISYREVEKTTHIVEYSEGKLVRDVVKPNKSGLHGTTVEFKVSKKYMGDDAYMPIDDVINWIDKLFYLDSDVLSKRKITCKLLVTNNGTTVSTHKFKPQPYVNLLDQILPANIKKKEMSDLTYFKGEKSFIENSKVLVEDKKGNNVVQNVDIEKVLHMDIAFKYCVAIDVSNGATYDTYCNYTNTIENGVHLDAFDEAYCRYMQNKINSTMSEAQRDKLKVTWDDIRTNLFAVINLSTNAQVGFVGNAKRSIGNKDLIPYIKELVTEGLDKFFEEHPSILDSYIKIIKINAKARLEAQRAKTATVKDKINTFSEHLLPNYIRCNNTGKQWKELMIVEGNSASSGVRNASDPNTQAIFLLRGVVFNPVKKPKLADAMANREFHDLVTVLRCGIGDKFDINKLYFDRINLFTDADIDRVLSM